jgi:hypothetical protein
MASRSSRSASSSTDHRERRGASEAGDPATEAERWFEKIAEAGRKRARYQEMAAEGLIDFEELRARLAVLEETRKTAEQELRALQHRAEHLAQLERKTACRRATPVLCPRPSTPCDRKNATERIE